MGKIATSLLLSLAVLSIGGCSAKKEQKVETSSSQSEVSETKESTKEKEPSKSELFDKLSMKEQIVLYTDIVDNRVKEYPGLEGLELIYYIDKDDLYVQLTSGVGTGHPIYQIKLDNKGATPKESVVYLGADGYQFMDVEQTLVKKETLFDIFEKREKDIKDASTHVKESSELKEAYERNKAIAKPKETQESVEVDAKEKQEGEKDVHTNVSQDEMLTYFKDYVMGDLGVTDNFSIEHARFGFDENGEAMIRYGGGFGYYARMEGTRIIYEGYTFGGVSEDGVVSKSPQNNAYYDVETGEHGLL